MAKRRMVWIALGVIGLLLAAIPLLWPEDEPEYNGRYLREWLEICERHAAFKNVEASPEYRGALEAVRSIGTNALPYYLDWITYEPPRWRRTLQRSAPGWITGNTNLNKFLLGRADHRVLYATRGFYILGTNASSAVPKLKSLMYDSSKPDSSAWAMVALASIGEPSLPVFKAALADTNLVNRPLMLYALWNAAEQAGTNAVLAILIEATRNQDASVRQAATNVLGYFAPKGPRME